MVGVPLIVAFVFTILVMIYAISRLKIHPFFAILSVSVIFAFVAGIPLVGFRDESGKAILGIVEVISVGFSGTFTSIGLVIILGAFIGMILERTGAALKMADCVVRLVGKKNPELAMMLMGWIVSIPVFCDSGFVVLNPIRKALVKRIASSSVAAAVALSMGLYISHCFIPPTPGPIAAANMLFKDGIAQEPNLLLVMWYGLLCSIIPLMATLIFAKWIGKRVKSRDELPTGEISQSYEQLLASYGKLPSAFLSFAPIFVPILLMALSSALTMMGSNTPLLRFLGTPVIAISVGVLIVVYLAFTCKISEKLYDITNETLKIVGPILFITAAGGVLGRVIAESSMVGFIKDNATALSTLGIFFPFILASILKSAQGSSTVAITTTAGIMAPLMGVMGLATPEFAALSVIAIGAGAMTVSHANDSYFWVVTNFSELDVKDGYKTQTLGTLILGLTSMLSVYLLYMFML